MEAFPFMFAKPSLLQSHDEGRANTGRKEGKWVMENMMKREKEIQVIHVGLFLFVSQQIQRGTDKEAGKHGIPCGRVIQHSISMLK